MNYYELYRKYDELMYLEMFFREQTESGKEDIVSLYQRVQNCACITTFILAFLRWWYLHQKQQSVCNTY